jgi:tRNA-2-methylthio-N6-dimethylallyladenosine synthase
VEEVKALSQGGFRQVTLLGQNVNSYRYKEYDFADLIQMTAGVAGIRRVRFTAPHPKDFPDRLIRAIAEHPKVCAHIHLPLQSGNNRVLELMRRVYTIESFRKLVEKIRGAIPGVALTTDIIVGFPTETDGEFADTYRAMRDIRFDAAFIFKYSERKGTIAQKLLEDDVAPEKKTERIVALVELQKQTTGEINQALVGQTFQVLVEGCSAKDTSLFVGRTDSFKNTVFSGDGFSVGDLVNVRIERSRGGTLYGHVEGIIE